MFHQYSYSSMSMVRTHESNGSMSEVSVPVMTNIVRVSVVDVQPPNNTSYTSAVHKH